MGRFGIALIHLASIAVIVLSVVASFIWIFSGRGWPELVAWTAALVIGGLFGSVVSSLLLRIVLTAVHRSAEKSLKGYLHGE